MPRWTWPTTSTIEHKKKTNNKNNTTMNRIAKSIVMGCIALAISTTLSAQQHQHKHHARQPQKIESLVSNLSDQQKKQLDELQKQSKERVDKMNKSMHAVKDSIRTLMNQEGDHSRELCPLFDREASLQSAISKEMYASKVKIGKILTPEQRSELKDKMSRCHKDKKEKGDKHLKKSKHLRQGKGQPEGCSKQHKCKGEHEGSGCPKEAAQPK